MSSPRITFAYQASSITDSWWLRLVQLGVEDDTATLADAAELIDTLYSIDACTKETTTTEDPDSSTTDDVVETEVRRVVCQYDDQANVDVQLHIIRSHQSAPYKLALQGGELKTVETITETITQTIVVEDADSLTLDYPVLGNFSASWAGAVYGSSGRITPAIHRTGNTLSFGGAAIKAGTITATYTTEYDLATITILGVDGQPGQCTARGFFHGLVEELELETPEPADDLGSCSVLWTVPSEPHRIECYRTVYVSQRCQCSHDELDGYSYEEVVDCPDYVKRCPGVLSECRHYLGTVVAPEYVECPGDMVEAVSVPAYYERMCCEAPSVTLPQCKELKTSWRGGLGINGGVEQARALYGDDVEIIPIGPPGGICGTWTKRQQIIGNSCCDGVPPLVWDISVSPEVMAPNSAVVIGVQGGRLPLTWEVDGVGFQFGSGSRKVETAARETVLSALVVACGTATITITDGCSTIVAYIRCTSGAWTTIYLSSAGLMGDSSGQQPYDGDPLPMIAGTGPIGTAGRYEQTAIVGKMKVWQRLQGGDGNTYNRKGFQTCVDICNGLLATPPADARFYLGPAFDYSHLCDTCGACTILQPDNTWWNYRLGLHSTINPDTPYPGWYNLYTIWISATGTQVWEWRC